MTTLITGASGFVGAAVLRRLLDTGHSVRALVRPNSDRANLNGLNVEIVTGDLRDPASLARAVQGCDAVFHVAADYRLWVPRPDEMLAANVDGSRALIRSAAEAGVRRIVYTSSVATLGIRADGQPGDEQTPVSLQDMIGIYKRSKYLAEDAVRDLVRQGAPVVIVNPSTPVGPRDIKPTPTGRLIVEAASGRMPAYVDTGLNIVHVDDVAEGHLLAFSKGRIGERYVLGGTNMRFGDILADIARLTGRKPPKVQLPHDLVMPIAWLAERFASLTGREPFATVDGVKMSKKLMFFSSAKAESELGYAPRPAIEALRDAIDWFRQHGYLDR